MRIIIHPCWTLIMVDGLGPYWYIFGHSLTQRGDLTTKGSWTDWRTPASKKKMSRPEIRWSYHSLVLSSFLWHWLHLDWTNALVGLHLSLFCSKFWHWLADCYASCWSFGRWLPIHILKDLSAFRRAENTNLYPVGFTNMCVIPFTQPNHPNYTGVYFVYLVFTKLSKSARL